MALDGTAVVISSDEEYEDVASPTMTGTPIGVPFDSATGKGKRFIFQDEEEEDVVAPTTVVEPPTTVVQPPTPAVVPTTTAVIPPGTVRTTIAVFQAVAVGGSAVVAPTTVDEPTTTVVATQTDPLVFPFVFPVRKGEKWWL